MGTKQGYKGDVLFSAKLSQERVKTKIFYENRKKREYSTFLPQKREYSTICNSFVGKTYVRLLARLTLVCGEHLHARVRVTCV